MGKSRWRWAAVLIFAAGCQGTGSSLIETPPLRPAGVEHVDDMNPVYIPLGPESYGQVFENVLSVLTDYGFEIRESNRWDGRVETLPRISPGIGLLFKPGSPDLYDRMLATLQTYRHRVLVEIQPAENGGFFVKVTANKELEDLPRPIRSTVGAAIFRNDQGVARQFEVIDPTFYEPNWFYRGRDLPLEQELIRRMKGCM